MTADVGLGNLQGQMNAGLLPATQQQQEVLVGGEYATLTYPAAKCIFQLSNKMQLQIAPNPAVVLLAVRISATGLNGLNPGQRLPVQTKRVVNQLNLIIKDVGKPIPTGGFPIGSLASSPAVAPSLPAAPPAGPPMQCCSHAVLQCSECCQCVHAASGGCVRFCLRSDT